MEKWFDIYMNPLEYIVFKLFIDYSYKIKYKKYINNNNVSMIIYKYQTFI